MKTEVSPQEYINLINEKIKQIDGYQYGMKVYLVPKEDNPTGYSWDREWLLEDIQSLVSMAEHELKKYYSVNVHLK